MSRGQCYRDSWWVIVLDKAMTTAPRPSILVGLELWSVSRSLDLISLQFGAKRHVPTRRDPGREVGEYALHAECRHEAFSNGNVVDLRLLVGSQGPLKVLSVREEPVGTLTLELNGDVVFRVIGDPATSGDEDNEQWRLFTPGSSAPHLIFAGGRYRVE